MPAAIFTEGTLAALAAVRASITFFPRRDLAGCRGPEVTGVRDELPLLVDGQTLEVENVIWCTGFRPGFSWIDLPILGDRQEPAHERGVVTSEPGLYFVGLHFLYSMTSETITGMQRDAKRIAKQIAARVPSDQPTLVAHSAATESA